MAVRTDLLVVSVVGMVCVAMPLVAGSQPDAKRKAPTMEERMKAWMECAQPGAEHASLGWYVGEWDVTMKMYWDPNTPPVETKSTAKFRWLVEGRWLIEEIKGDYQGRAFVGFGLLGYDNIKKQFVTTWIDNYTTALGVAYGTTDSTGKKLTSFSHVDDPATGEHDRIMQYVTVRDGDDAMTWKALQVVEGEIRPVMEARYARRR